MSETTQHSHKVARLGDRDAHDIADEVVEVLERAMYIEDVTTNTYPLRTVMVTAPDCGCEYDITIAVTKHHRTP